MALIITYKEVNGAKKKKFQKELAGKRDERRMGDWLL